jgi:hypothetical protein
VYFLGIDERVDFWEESHGYTVEFSKRMRRFCRT